MTVSHLVLFLARLDVVALCVFGLFRFEDLRGRNCRNEQARREQQNRRWVSEGLQMKEAFLIRDHSYMTSALGAGVREVA